MPTTGGGLGTVCGLVLAVTFMVPSTPDAQLPLAYPRSQPSAFAIVLTPTSLYNAR
jgi:hypothetical protein